LDDEGVLTKDAKESIINAKVFNELANISNNYNDLSNIIELACMESYKIKNVEKTLSEIDFKNDTYNIKEYLMKRINDNDIMLIINGKTKYSPYYHSKILECPATTIIIERSFSMLQKVFTKDRHFNYKNLKKYMIVYFYKDLNKK
jgi:hypothetical protein